MYNPYGVSVDRINKQIEDLQQMKGQMLQPAPINNFINTNKVELEGKIITDGQTAQDTIVQNKTIIVDEEHRKVSIKEPNGNITREYEIIIPKTKEELRIEELENNNKLLQEKIKEMEVKYGYKEFNQPIKSIE